MCLKYSDRLLKDDGVFAHGSLITHKLCLFSYVDPTYSVQAKVLDNQEQALKRPPRLMRHLLEQRLPLIGKGQQSRSREELC